MGFADLTYRKRTTPLLLTEWEVIHAGVLIGYAHRTTARKGFDWEAFDLDRNFVCTAGTRTEAARTVLVRSGRG